MKNVIRIIAVLLVVGAIIAAIVASLQPKAAGGSVWDKDTTMGSLEAKNHFIIYSDILCPYCVAFENAMAENEQELKEYLEKNDILIEVRLSDFLYEYGEMQPINSRYSAEAVFCAKNEGKFWDYYDHIITTVWNDYFKEKGKSAFTEMQSLDKDYWISLGKEVGLGESFEKCVNEDKTLSDVMKNASKTAKLVKSGLPSFKFNNYTPSGFDLSWGWSRVLDYFEAGLASKK